MSKITILGLGFAWHKLAVPVIGTKHQSGVALPKKVSSGTGVNSSGLNIIGQFLRLPNHGQLSVLGLGVTSAAHYKCVHITFGNESATSETWSHRG